MVSKIYQVTFPLYFILLAIASLWAYRRTQRIKKKTDALSAYYLGGRSFGPLLTAASLFGTVYSGYTVSGLPNEAFRSGWMALHWLPMFFTVAIALMGTGYRLRKAGAERNHSSPVDFITDRYQSQILRYTVLFLQILPTLLYLAVHIIAIRRAFNGVIGISPNNNLPVILITAFLLGSELIGGLSSVAITDTIQAIIMVAAFVLIPIALKLNFGGWVELDPSTYPRPEFYQTPSKDSQWLFWQFSLINVSFLTLPHVMQRVYAARDLKSLKFGYTVLSIAPWLIVSSVFIGTYAVALLVNPDGTPMRTYDVYASVLQILSKQGGFAEFASYVGTFASIASILSTTNSLIVAISHLLTEEIIQPLSRANASGDRLVWYGRASSTVLVIFAMFIGLFWDTKNYDMIAIAFPIYTQAGPAFLFGLFSYNQKTDVHPWNLSIGGIAGTISVFGLYFGYFKPMFGSDALPIDSGFAGLAVNVLVLVVAEGIRRLIGKTTEPEDGQDYLSMTNVLYPRPSWDIPAVQKRFGENTLTPQLLWKTMEGVYEPLTSWSWTLLMIVAISFVTPFVEESQPALEESDGLFSFSNLPPTVNGMPWWAFKIILTSLVPAVILYVSIYNLQDTFPSSPGDRSDESDIDYQEKLNEMSNATSDDDDEDAIVHEGLSDIDV